jgi:hypothetical protein
VRGPAQLRRDPEQWRDDYGLPAGTIGHVIGFYRGPDAVVVQFETETTEVRLDELEPVPQAGEEESGADDRG